MIERRISLTAAPQSIAIGVDKSHIRAWLDAGSPDTAISINGPTDDDTPKIDAASVWSWDDPQGGVVALHLLADAAAGALNLKAW